MSITPERISRQPQCNEVVAHEAIMAHCARRRVGSLQWFPSHAHLCIYAMVRHYKQSGAVILQELKMCFFIRLFGPFLQRFFS